MGKKLVIVESPAKVKTISKFLGDGFIVTASYGHCYQIDPKSMSVDIEHGFEPKYVACIDKKKVITDIKSMVKKCDMVYLATDPDREGEAIAAHLRDFVIEGACPTKRVTFQEITKKAVLSAFDAPKDLDEDMYKSQKARSVLDRLVGYGVSPILWKKVCKGTSAGRVQSIGLKIISERQKEIDAFVPEEYWTINGFFKPAKGDSFEAIYKIKDRIENGKQAHSLLEDIKSVADWAISETDESEKSVSPSPLFKTSSLQQAASSLFGWSSKKTMQVAQALYEGFSVQGADTTGLITYHRTDSLNISKEAMDDCRKLIVKDYGTAYLPASPRYFKTDNKSAQEAHEGIRPSHLELSLVAIRNSIPIDAFKLYELIYCKFIASQMTAAKMISSSITVKGKEHIFTASGQRTTFDGFYAAWKFSGHKDNLIPEISKGDIVSLSKADTEQHFTKPPSYFSDGSLVKVLEEEGVGRPSTYASIIDTLIKRKYVSRDGKKLKGEELGRMVSDYLTAEFPELMSNGYTSRVEEKLDEVAVGKSVWNAEVGDFYTELKKRIEAADDKVSTKKSEDSGILCPTCKCNNLFVKRSKYGEFYGCGGFLEKGAKKCKATFMIGPNKEPQAKKGPEYMEGHVCDKCGSKIAVRVASKGKNSGNKFFGCSGYPKCKRVFNADGTPIEFKAYKKK